MAGTKRLKLKLIYARILQSYRHQEKTRECLCSIRLLVKAVKNKAGNLLSSLLNLITDQNQGGFSGFLDRFRKTGLSDALNSWVGKGENTTISGEQVEFALGTALTAEMASQAGLDADVARASLGRMIPAVVSQLTPNGTVPTDDDLLSRIGGYLSGIGSSTVSTTGVVTNEAFDRIGTAGKRNAIHNI